MAGKGDYRYAEEEKRLDDQGAVGRLEPWSAEDVELASMVPLSTENGYCWRPPVDRRKARPHERNIQLTRMTSRFYAGL